MFRYKTVAVPLLAAVMATVSACTPPPPGAATSGFSKSCVYDRVPFARVDLTVIETVPGGTLHVEYLIFPLGNDPWNDYLYESENFNDVEAGATYSVGNSNSTRGIVDPGRCLHITGSEGVVYRVTPIPVTDPESLFLYALGINPQYYAFGCPLTNDMSCPTR